MKQIRTFALLIIAAILFSGCAVTLPVSATSNPMGKKVGTSSGTGYFGILMFGVDASIRSAAKNGGITKISSVDFKSSNILGIVQTYETIVTGD